MGTDSSRNSNGCKIASASIIKLFFERLMKPFKEKLYGILASIAQPGNETGRTA
jgi:hypothetical protein